MTVWPVECSCDGTCGGMVMTYTFQLAGRDLGINEAFVTVPYCVAELGDEWPAAVAEIERRLGRRVVSTTDCMRRHWSLPTEVKPIHRSRNHDQRRQLWLVRDMLHDGNPRRECCLCGRRGRTNFTVFGVAWVQSGAGRALCMELRARPRWACDPRWVSRTGGHDGWLRCGQTAWQNYESSVGEIGQMLAHKQEVSQCRKQLTALKRFLKTGDPAALTSLPEGFGPQATSPG